MAGAINIISMKTFAAFIFALILCFSISSFAGDLLIAKKGESLMSDDFSSPKGLVNPWLMPKGKWEVKDGVLRGSEVKADKHAAVLHYQKKNHNLIVQFDFELQGAQFLHLSFNHAKGHLWRLVITEKGMRLQKDKDKKDLKSKSEFVGESIFAIKQGERHAVTVEIVGSQIAVQMDDNIILKASNPKFDTEKPNIRFIVRGESVLIDNVKAWEAEAK